MPWPTTPALTVAGRQPARRLPGVEHEIVQLLVVGVGQVDDEPVARGHLDPRRGEPHAVGLHHDPGRFARGVHGLGVASGYERGRVGGDAGRNGEHERGEPGRRHAAGAPRRVLLVARPRWWRIRLRPA